MHEVRKSSEAKSCLQCIYINYIISPSLHGNPVSERCFIEKAVDTLRTILEMLSSHQLIEFSHLRILLIIFVINSCIAPASSKSTAPSTRYHGLTLLKILTDVLCLTGTLCFCLWIVILDLGTKISCFNSYFNCSVCDVIFFLRYNQLCNNEFCN